MRIFILMFLLPLALFGQYNSARNYNWIFGDNLGIHFNNGTNLVGFKTSIATHEASAAVSDEFGNLLFYTDGTTIWNREHNIMLNGDTLTGVVSSIFGYTVTISSSQGALIVPVANNHYYVFSIIQSGVANFEGKLYYSEVDMSLDNGLGAVVAGNKGVLLDSMLLESMAGICGDNNNAWVLVHSRQQAIFKAFEVTDNAITSTPVVSEVGSFIPSGSAFSGEGYITVAPNRRKIALSNFSNSTGSGNIELYDFNPSSGVVCNPLSLSPWSTPLPIDTLQFSTVIFSPNSKVLYAKGFNTPYNAYQSLFQYDLSQPTGTDIINSRVYIDSCYFGLMRLGPDGKIYTLGSYRGDLAANNLTFSRVNDPDTLGQGCNFEPTAYTLSGRNPLGLGSEIPAVSSYPTDTIYRSFCVQVCSKDTTIQYSEGAQYLWNDGSVLPSINISQSGTYWILIAGGCSNAVQIDTYYVHINNYSVQLEFTEGCRSTDSVYAIARFPADDTTTYTFTWLDQDNNILKASTTSGADSLLQLPGNYILHIRTAASCNTSMTCERTLSFTIEPPMPFSALFNIDPYLCQSRSYFFENTSTGNLSTWYWNFGDGNSSEQKYPQHSYVLPGNYRVALIASNAIPCYDTFYREVVVDTLGKVSFSTDKTELCSGDHIWLFPAYTGNITELYWNLGGTNRYENAQSEIQHAYDKAGIYPVTLTGKFRACPDTSFTDTIKVFPTPVVDLGENSFICLKDMPIMLKNRVHNPGNNAYFWSTGAKTESIEAKHPDIYSLTVTSEQGCNNTGTVEVKKDCYTDIPNAFTPNGDGVNDYFFPRQFLSISIKQFRMQVFNRWGEKVFETIRTDSRGWDGKFNGKEQPGGVYIYIIEIAFDNKQEEQYKGNVLLLR